MAQIHRASPERQQSPHLPTPTPQLPVLPPSLCLVTSEGVRREAARGSWLSAAPQYPRPSVSSAHALPCGEPQLGPPPVWDRSREPERLALPVLSLLCPFFPLLPAFSLSLPGSCLQPNPAQPRPTSCSLAPQGPSSPTGQEKTARSLQEQLESPQASSPEPAARRGGSQRSPSPSVPAGDEGREGQGPAGVWRPVQRRGKGSLSTTCWPRRV